MVKLVVIKKLSNWVPVIVWGFVIYILSSSTGGGGKLPLPDYVLHAIEFGVFALLLYRALILSGVSKIISFALTIFFGFLYGLFDEVHQALVPGRHSTFNDVVFDTIGIIVVIISIWILLPKAPVKLKSWVEKSGIK